VKLRILFPEFEILIPLFWRYQVYNCAPDFKVSYARAYINVFFLNSTILNSYVSRFSYMQFQPMMTQLSTCSDCLCTKSSQRHAKKDTGCDLTAAVILAKKRPFENS